MISIRFCNRFKCVLTYCNAVKPIITVHKSNFCQLIEPVILLPSITNNYNFNKQSYRQYAAKGKDKLKTKARDKGVKFAKIELNEEQLQNIFDLPAYKTQLQKSMDTLQQEFIKNLSLRSTTGSIETLKVNVDGKDHELQELAQVIRKNPKTIVLNMIAFPQTIPAALQAIQKSGMNLNPQQDGTTIFIPVPKITKEHREGLSKNAKALFIKCRDSIKDSQNMIIKKLKKNTEISEDENHSVQGQVVAMADKYIHQAETLLQAKQKELLGEGSK